MINHVQGIISRSIKQAFGVEFQFIPFVVMPETTPGAKTKASYIKGTNLLQIEAKAYMHAIHTGFFFKSSRISRVLIDKAVELATAGPLTRSAWFANHTSHII